MMKIPTTGLVLALLLAAGCVSYEYKGEKGGEPTDSVAVFMDSGKIGRPYQVLGEATVAGDYHEVTRDRLMDKLVSEAEKSGADAVLIVEQQVLPYGGNSPAQGRFLTAFDYDDTNQSWNQVYRDVDQRYSSLFNSSLQGLISRDGSGGAARENVGAARSYRRIIRAEFLKYREEGASPKVGGEVE